ncbi:MAG: EVE domain-containing protein [Betaproteobacteria bacterium]|nr:EVE domain-containing protein [Candidatus Dechloromonas phosphorivorans]
MQYWLMKSEPDEVSIDDLAVAPKQTVPWFGVRNYQARNFMRDTMQIGDLAFFYHSGGAAPGIAEFARSVPSLTGPNPVCCTQRDFPSAAVNPYFDPKSSPDKPRWWLREVRFVSKSRYLPLAELRAHPELANMRLLARGNRLSITPVSNAEWAFITQELMGQ